MKKHLILFSTVFFTLFIITITPKAQAQDPDLTVNYWQTYPVEGEFTHSAKSMQTTHQEFRIPYKITNGTLEKITVDQKLRSILAEIKNAGPGTFDIAIPRNLIDKKNNNQDDDQFFVIAEGKEADFTETNNDCSRNLSIKFKEGVKQIEIIGTLIASQDSPIGYVPNLMTEVYPVHVVTDMAFYAKNHPILISGCTSLALPNDVISLDIFNHEKKIHDTYQITPAENGTFEMVPSLNAGIFTISATFHNATDSVNIGVVDDIAQSSIGQGPRPIRPDIREIPLPADVRKTMQETCSHMSNLTKEEKEFWKTLHVRLIRDTPEFKSLEGMRGSINITSGITATSCPPITGTEGTFVSENGMKHKFQLGYNGNNFRYQIDAIFPPQYKEKTLSPLQQFRSGIPIDEIQCKDGLQLITKASNGNPACVTSHTKETLIQRGWAEPQDSFASKILTELRSGIWPITTEQGEFVKKIALMNITIQKFVKDKTLDFECCSYLTSSEPKNLNVIITFFDRDNKKQLEAVMDLQEVRVIKTQVYDTVHLGKILDKKYTVQVNGSIFEIRYSIIGSQLQEIIADPNTKSIIVNLENSEKGQMTIEIPRKVIDARIGQDGKSGEDADFFVLVNGSEVNFEEIRSTVARTLTIPLENDSSQIEIIGTVGYPYSQAIQ